MNKILAGTVILAALLLGSACGSGNDGAGGGVTTDGTPTTITTTPVAETTTTVPEPTTTVKPTGRARFDEIVAQCEIPDRFITGDQMILDLYESISNPSLDPNEVIVARYCVNNDALSPGGNAVLGTASGMSGPVSVVEDGVKFTQIYSEVSGQETDILIVEVA